ncbi:unnamed protein product [Brassica napus]|uniref:(rape) hypothetical protein n=1 Tax=Brassica napus TaxID=3708 RepID=A0A816VLC3_BRANA|nr:unnamed protein product [Brassica napus]
MIAVGGGESRRSRSCSNGSSSVAWTALTKPMKSLARTSSEGMRLGRVAKWIRSGIGSDPMSPSHGDDEGDGEVGVAEDEAFAEVHHRVDVASSGPRHGHHVAESEWVRFSWIHGVRSERLWSV